MRGMTGLLIFLIVCGWVFPAPAVYADVNEEIAFSNYTDEFLYVELVVEDDYGWAVYDVYVETYGCSYANFWAETPHAVYSACAYGEFSGDFYGCIEGGIRDWDKYVEVDPSGYPYFSDPPDQACDTYIFETYSSEADVIVVADDGYHDAHVSAGCFIDTLSVFQ